MQEMTKSRISPKFLQHLLDSKNWQKIEFVLNHLLEQKPVAPQYIDKVAEVMPTAGIDHIELAIEYLQQASPGKSVCYQKLIGALGKLDEYGAAMAIEDGPVLARALDQGAVLADSLALYERNRRARATRVVDQSNDNRRLFHLTSEDHIRAAFAKRDEGGDRNAWLYSYNPLTVELV